MRVSDLLVASAMGAVIAYIVLMISTKRRLRKYRPRTSGLGLQLDDFRAVEDALTEAASEEERRSCERLLAHLRLAFAMPAVAMLLMLASIVWRVLLRA